MELKYAIGKVMGSSLKVLIVPLWNWNKGTRLQSIVGRGSNRTFMELKYADDSLMFRILQF